jgi:hypothetical protein
MNINKNQKDLFVQMVLTHPEMRGILFGLCAKTKLHPSGGTLNVSFDNLELADFFEQLASFIRQEDAANKA